MSGLSEYGLMKDNIAAAIGLGTLLFLVIIAVVIFVAIITALCINGEKKAKRAKAEKKSKVNV